MKKLIELIFILDRSGSMSGLESDTIGGFNEMILKQKSLDGRVLVTTVLFDNQYEVIHDSVNLNDIKPLTTNDYFVRGTTALLDALGKTLTNTTNKHLKLEAKDWPDEVMFIITTDGMENASREFNYEKVKKLIEDKKTNNNWQFIFLGANIDAAKEASKFGIDREFSADF